MQATALVRSGASVDAAIIQPFLTQAETAFAQGATAADDAAAGSPDPAAIDSLQSTIQALGMPGTADCPLLPCLDKSAELHCSGSKHCDADTEIGCCICTTAFHAA